MDLQELNDDLEKDAIFRMGKGFIRLPRGLMEGCIEKDPQTRRMNRTFQTLLTLANYSDGIVEYKNTKRHLRKGELICTLRELAEISDVGHHTQVKRYLKQMEDYRMIEVEACKGGYRIRILRYEEITGSYLTNKGVRYHKQKQPARHPLDELSPTGSGRTIRQEQEELEEKKRLHRHKFE